MSDECLTYIDRNSGLLHLVPCDSPHGKLAAAVNAVQARNAGRGMHDYSPHQCVLRALFIACLRGHFAEQEKEA